MHLIGWQNRPRRLFSQLATDRLGQLVAVARKLVAVAGLKNHNLNDHRSYKKMNMSDDDGSYPMHPKLDRFR